LTEAISKKKFDEKDFLRTTTGREIKTEGRDEATKKWGACLIIFNSAAGTRDAVSELVGCKSDYPSNSAA